MSKKEREREREREKWKKKRKQKIVSDFSTRRWLLPSAIFIFHFVRFTFLLLLSSRRSWWGSFTSSFERNFHSVSDIRPVPSLATTRGVEGPLRGDDSRRRRVGGWCLESDRRDYYEWNGVLNNFVLDIEAKKRQLSYFVDATRRCFLIPFAPEIEVLFTRSLTNLHEYSFRRRTSSARVLYISDRDRTSTRAQPRWKTYREDLNSFGCS